MAPFLPNQEAARNARRRKIPIDDNGEPVITVKKKRLNSRPQGKTAATTKPSPKAASHPQMRAVSVEEVIDDEDLRSFAVPRNPRNILESTDGSDDNPVNLPKTKGQLRREQVAAIPTLRKAPIPAAGPSRTRAASVEEVIDEEPESLTSAAPRNPRNILEASDGSDDEPGKDHPPSESAMDVDNNDTEVHEEDEEAELGLISVTEL